MFERSIGSSEVNETTIALAVAALETLRKGASSACGTGNNGIDAPRASDTLKSHELQSTPDMLSKLATLEQQADAMSSVLRALQDEIHAVQIECTMHSLRGIYRLPNEVLQSIFCYAVLENQKTQRYRIAHVSLRFREVALNTPSMWTDIRRTQSTEEILMSLQLSKSAGLQIDASIKEGALGLTNFLELVSPHGARWSYLIYQFEIGHVAQEFPAHLPALEHIKCIGDNSIMKYIDAPKLARLSGIRTFIGRRVALPITVTKCDLHWSQGLDVASVVVTLGALNNSCTLEELKLTISMFDPEDQGEGNYKDVEFKKLRSLSVEFVNPPSHHPVLTFMQKLVMPTLTDFELSCKKIILDTDVQRIVSSVNYLAFVRNVRISIDRVQYVYAVYPDELEDPLGQLIMKMPVLESLSLDVSDFYLPLSGNQASDVDIHFRDPANFPPLRILEFIHCSSLEAENYLCDTLLSYARQGRHWGKFEKLVIHQCKDVTAKHIPRIQNKLGDKVLDWMP